MRPVAVMAAVVVVVLVAFASGYGYHRDELYFIAAGEHLAWGYADQGPLTPFLARVATEVAPNSLTLLRLPSALAAGAIVLLTGLLTRDLGGSRRAQQLAAACAAVGSIVLFTGHLLSTSTFDLLVWTAVTWLAVRAVRHGDERAWLAAGAVLGIGLLNKPLPAFLVLGLLAGVLIAGPRQLLRSRHVWAGAGIALLLWLPWIIWQFDHDWPQLEVGRSVAGGESTSAEPWWAVVPFQVLLISPVLAPVWIAGLIRLFRHDSLRDLRFLGWTWAVLAVVFMATGGKPYYLAGLLPLLLAAGAPAVDAWLDRGGRARAVAVVAALALSAVIDATIALPVLPEDKVDPVIAVNEDVAETIGWPDFAQTVAQVHRDLGRPPRTVVLAANYGQAGAVDRFGGPLGLPRAYSGHNAYGDQGPPPPGGAPVIAIGLRPDDLARLRGCRPAARIDNRHEVDNEERGTPVVVCAGPRRSWRATWPALRRYG